jgi:hypothetical protein
MRLLKAGCVYLQHKINNHEKNNDLFVTVYLFNHCAILPA